MTMTNFDQIVRPLQHGELPPAYSTEELLRGVCHIVRLPGTPSRPSVTRTAIERGRAKSIETRQRRAAERFLAHFETVKEMLLNGSTNSEIAAELDVSLATVGIYIAKSTELQKLSQARPNQGKARDEGSMSNDSRTRFLQQESSIRRALKNDSLWVVAKRFQFDHRTLKRLLGGE